MRKRQGFNAPGLGAWVVSAVLLAGCASGPPKAERYIAPPVGATWTFQVTNTGSFGDAVKAQQTVGMRDVVFESRPYHRFESGAGTTLQDDSAGLFMVLGPGDKPLMRYDPPLSYSFPLEVGKTWTQDIVLTVGGANKVPMKVQWKVEAYEDVTVPAGTFKTWRVVFTDNFGHKQTTWSTPEKLGVFVKRMNERAPTHPQGGAGTQLIELVTVPTVK